MPEPLKMVSVMAPGADPFYRSVARHLAGALGRPVEFVAAPPWPERERMLYQGQADLGFVCGLGYVLQDRLFELLAAPVMEGSRYGGRPVYFSEVVVRRDSPFRSFPELRGTVWAYNEPYSHSGYNVLRHHLARLGETEGFFARAVESGSHQRSLEMVLEGSVDSACIDTTVLEWWGARHPGWRQELRSLEVLGPSPMPPAVASRQLEAGLVQALRRALLEMGRSGPARADLLRAGVRAFVPVADSDYDPIRFMARRAARVRLCPCEALAC
ncbi:MAG TPA: PhnD/SsuA/transferrin family substrate-binding protein [Candidatus Nitrosotenuis sp.]|nr:PhnD/SsuA/transferrin family substrate-binding protein [Candidatus Nitrosotenuis sp.]